MPKVLIAEDDKFIVSAYKAKLNKLDFQVETAFDGDEVMQKMDTFNPDIVLLDVMMPKKDGFTVLQELRKNPKWKNLPIILATNLSQQVDAERAKELGATDFLIKSNSSLNDIVEKIRKSINTESLKS